MYVYRFIITFPTQNKAKYAQKAINGTERRLHQRRYTSINRLSHAIDLRLRVFKGPKILGSRRPVRVF